MNLIKWLRRNNTKIMAVVVIVLMFAFVGGSALQYLLQPSGGAKSAVYYYGQNSKITRLMIQSASNEIEVLQALQSDAILRQQDLRGILLGELLFSQSRGSPALMNQVMRMVRQNQFLISDKQLNQMYEERQTSPAIYWLLLTREAESAGIRVPTSDVGALLNRLMSPQSQLFRGQSYPVVMGGLVGKFRVSEDTILATFGKLLAVLQYSQTICSVEDVTLPELTHIASQGGNTLNAEFVQLPARAFIDKQNPPADAALQAQFDKYKNNPPGHVTQDNPFGFGYKLPDRIQLDYVALKLKDVAGIVQPPTQEDTELYYRQNRQRLFTREVPSDPNDPNSPKTQQVTSYAEVADTIMEQLNKQRITAKAEQILEEVRNAADADLAVGATESKDMKAEQLKAKAGDYTKIAQQVSTKYGITLYNGQTGWLNAVEMQTDKHLGRLAVSSQATNALHLSQILFSVKELGDSAAVVMFAPNARMFTTIGPASDPMSAANPDLTGQIMIVARVVGLQKAATPENLDLTYSTRTLDLGDATAPKKDKDNVFSVREKVMQDAQKLAAWDTTKGKAGEFLALASKDGWDPAVAKFNDLYGKQAKEEPNDPNVFKIDHLNDLQRISNAQLQVVATQTIGNPAAATIAAETRVEKQLADQFFSLVPANTDAAPNMPQVLEFKPGQCFYVVKNVAVKWINQQQYERMKARLLEQEDFIQTQNLAVVHFNPSNILKRMNWRPANKTEQTPVQGASEPEPVPEDGV
jgi:hypothetical protein